MSPQTRSSVLNKSSVTKTMGHRIKLVVSPPVTIAKSTSLRNPGSPPKTYRVAKLSDYSSSSAVYQERQCLYSDRHPKTGRLTIYMETGKKFALTAGALALQQMLLRDQIGTESKEAKHLIQQEQEYQDYWSKEETESVMDEAWRCQHVLMREGLLQTKVLEEVVPSMIEAENVNPMNLSDLEDVEKQEDSSDDSWLRNDNSWGEHSHSSTSIEDRPEDKIEATRPLGFTRDEIRGGWRPRMLMDDFDVSKKRTTLRRRWDAICEMAKEERRMEWVDGDSDLDFSEWEEVNKKRKSRLQGRV